MHGPTCRLHMSWRNNLRLVDDRQYDTPRAKELRAKLDDWSGGQEPRLVEADLKIANLRWEAGQ